MKVDYQSLLPEARLSIARNSNRPRADDYIRMMFTDFFEQKGDHCYGEDKSILGGIAKYRGLPVTVIGQRRGHTYQQNKEVNYGMTNPEGFRKSLRLIKQAEKFGRPVITFVDTPGANPDDQAEEHGQGEAIAQNLAQLSVIRVPIIAILIGEGNSGGALALCVANRILMQENAVFSVLSPEGFAAILWKDSSRRSEACRLMKFTSKDLLESGIVDMIVPEPPGGAQNDWRASFQAMNEAISTTLASLINMSAEELIRSRYEKFRGI